MAEQPILGAWWLPETPDERWPGNLFISDDSTVRLELMTSTIRDTTPRYHLLHGEAGGRRYSAINLNNVSFGFNWSTADTKSEVFLVNQLIQDHFLDSSDEQFERFSFSVEGLQDWTRLTGISSQWTQSETQFDYDRTYYQTNPEPIDISIDGLTFRFLGVRRVPNERWSISVTEDTQIHVTAKEPKAIGDWLFDVVRPFQRLIQFSVKTGGNLQRLGVSHKLQDTGGGAQDLDWFTVITNSGNSEFAPKFLRANRPLFDLSTFAQDPSRLASWYNLHAEFRLPLVAMLQSSGHAEAIDYVFFVHARLLERLIDDYPSAYLCDKATARRIAEYAANQVDEQFKEAIAQKIRSQIRADLRVPVRDCVQRWLSSMDNWILTEEQSKWIARKVVDTRNHFAHQGDGDPAKQIPLGAFRVFTSMVRTLIDFEVAHKLGIEASYVLDRLKDTHQWIDARQVKEVWTDEQGETTSS